MEYTGMFKIKSVDKPRELNIYEVNSGEQETVKSWSYLQTRGTWRNQKIIQTKYDQGVLRGLHLIHGEQTKYGLDLFCAVSRDMEEILVPSLTGRVIAV
jgi:hypothetical protein